MRAVEPTREGTVERAGATLHYEVYETVGGSHGPTVVLLPTWELVHSGVWKMQIGFLSRYFRLVVYDAVGTGRSSRPLVPERYTHGHRIGDALAVLDAADTGSAVMVGSSRGGELGLYLAALHPDRVQGVVAIGTGHAWDVEPDRGERIPFDPVTNPVPEGWAKVDPAYSKVDYADFVHFFVGQVVSDPHSTKGFEDVVGWALEQRPDVLEWTNLGEYDDLDVDDVLARLKRLTVPVLIVHGTADQVTSVENVAMLHDWIPGSELLLVEGAGHAIAGRYPVYVNHLVRDFTHRVAPSRGWGTSGSGVPGVPCLGPAWTAFGALPKRVLYLSSPIGLGHARRDVAIADELAKANPDLQIDWLAQDPVTRVLEAAGHRVHPASGLLASESAHFEAACGDHALDAFQATRDMDEIFCHNFHVFDDVLAAGQYDLVIADEAWDVDHHLFENAHLKKAPLVWLTDFVGFLPMSVADDREAALTRDYNLEMLEHVDRHPRLRDQAVFVGDPDDIVEDTFGDGLPGIRAWTQEHYDFAGYITGFDPRSLGDRGRLRSELGFKPDEQVCIVAVGGTAVGTHLLRRVVDAYPAARHAIPQLRMIVVTGPRIDPTTLPQTPGVEYHGYVDRLYRWLAACDLAVVQGGLTTCMELTAAKIPFIYVPLRHHFEQNFHVRARLARYHAGRCLDYDQLDPDTLAAAMVDQLTHPADYLDVNTTGATHAAQLIHHLL
jgi:pimeloyl-ACP methyl ester carboxylesterase/predicted glycosyltransferase